MAGALIYDNYEKFCRQAAEHILGILKLALVHNKRCSMVLAGGSTPGGVYRYLAEHSEDFNWDYVDFFIGDERCVPENHEDSNYKMIEENFLSLIQSKAKNVYKIDSSLNNAEAAEDYHRRIKDYLEKKSLFDIVLLGMGPDGHTASLFPDYPEIHEKSKLAVLTEKEGPLPPFHQRITMTLPTLNRSSHVIFLLRGGDEKRTIMDKVLHPGVEEKRNGMIYPVQRIAPEKGRIYWYFSS